jgi:hypothetical protein
MRFDATWTFFCAFATRIEHRYIPALDVLVTSEAQAMLLNLETVLVKEYGEEAALGDQLIVPLQLSAIRSEAQLKSLKQLESQIPIDVMDFLARHREEVPADVLRSHQDALPLFFVPVSANRERSADAIVRFLRPGEVPPEVESALQKIAVVVKPKPVSVVSAVLLRPTEVVNLVAARLPYRFTTDSHTRCWRYFKVRPPSNAAEPAAQPGPGPRHGQQVPDRVQVRARSTATPCPAVSVVCPLADGAVH